jgi:DegV family protein with EDD domain
VYAKAAEGADGVVGIHISNKLSAIFSTAQQAKDMLSGARIEVIDTGATAMALGFVVLAAARAAAEGKSFEAVVKAARDVSAKVGLTFTVETLEYLRRGGRIGGAQAFIGGLLDAKPILELRDGRVEPVERVRTKRKAVERVLETIAAKIEGKSPIRLATIHAAAPQEAAELLEKAKARLGAVEAILAEASPTVATHAGPGTVGLAYCAGS